MPYGTKLYEMVENYLATDVEMSKGIEALNEKLDSVIARVYANEKKLAQLQCKYELYQKYEGTLKRFRAQSLSKKSLPSKEVDNSLHRDQLGDFGLVPLSEGQVRQIRAASSSCVRFIGNLVQASFPNGYFENHFPNDVTELQLKRLYEITSAHFNEIKRARKKPVKLTLGEVVNVIRTYIYNAHNRGRKRINETIPSDYSSSKNDVNGNMSQDSTGSVSVFNDDGFIENDTDGDCCDRPCDPPNHYPDCKNFTGVVHLDGKYQSYEEVEWAEKCRTKAAECPKFDISHVESGSVESAGNPRECKIQAWQTKTNGSPGFHRCNICDKYFATQRGVTRHKLIHTDPKSWNKCPDCDHRASDVSNLKKHIGLKHGKCDADRHKCDICFKLLATMRNLERHKRIVHKK